MIDRIANAWAVTWAICHYCFIVPVWRWFLRHRDNNAYFVWVGFKIGILASIIILVLEART